MFTEDAVLGHPSRGIYCDSGDSHVTVDSKCCDIALRVYKYFLSKGQQYYRQYSIVVCNYIYIYKEIATISFT